MKKAPLMTLLITISILFSTGGNAQQTFQLSPYYRTVTISGLTHPRKEIAVTSEASGKCLSIHADIGEKIPTTGILAEIDTTYLELDLHANKIAQQRLQRKLDQEKKTLQRYTVLIKKQSTAQAKYDEIALDVDLTDLALKELKNDEARLKEKMKRHQITAPVGWEVIERFTEPGEYVREGQKIAHLGDFKNLLVKLAVTYSELQTLRNLQVLSLYLPDLDERIEASLYQISPIFDENTRKIPIEVIIHTSQTDFNLPLRGGMRAELEFQNMSDSNVYAIPSSALISSYDAHWLVSAGGKKIPVILLDRFETSSMAVITGDKLSSDVNYLKEPKQ